MQDLFNLLILREARVGYQFKVDQNNIFKA